MKNTPEQFLKAKRVLNNGGIIAYPTDTTYGIGCDAENETALKRIFQIKGRNFNKPLSLAFSSLAMLDKYAEIETIPRKFLDQIFPGPVTLLLNKKNTVSGIITAKSAKVGARIPNCEDSLELIEALGRPIVTTSANISGEPDPVTADEVKLDVDFIYRGECFFKKPSTIIDIEKLEIVRKGVNWQKYQRLIDQLKKINR